MNPHLPDGNTRFVGKPPGSGLFDFGRALWPVKRHGAKGSFFQKRQNFPDGERFFIAGTADDLVSQVFGDLGENVPVCAG